MGKQTLVLVPGHMCDERLWDHQTRYLGDIADVIIGETRLDDSMAGIAKRILDQSPDRFALAGLSMGGHIVMEIMRQAPERVTKLALLDTAAADDTPERRAVREGMADQFAVGDVKILVEDFLQLLLSPERLNEDPVLVAQIREMMIDTANMCFPKQVKALLKRPDSRPDMPHYTCPTLIICGRQDYLTPWAGHEEMADLIPGARLIPIEDCAHMSTMERPQAVTALMRDWLMNC